jgi:hypothetical protein
LPPTTGFHATPENSSARLRHEREDMAGQTSDELLALFDTAKLNARYWAIFRDHVGNHRPRIL